MKTDRATQVFVTDADRLAQGLLNSDYLFDPVRPDFKGGAYTLRSWRDDFYEWRDGCWVRLSDAEMKRMVVEHIRRLNDQAFDDEQQISISTHRVNNILLCLKGRIGISERRELNTWEDGRERLYNSICVKNGLLLLRKNGSEEPTLLEHTPHFFGLVRLPFDYDPSATCPQWLNFLDDVMLGNAEYIALLQEWVGYLFRPDLREQKFLLCVGEGANGKGVFFEVVQALVGKENCSEVSIARFSDRFALNATLGKVVNATSESSHIIASQAENILKSFVAGDRFTFDRKFKEPLTNVAPTAKVMISTNALPRFTDKTEGIWRRILLVAFDKTIPTELQIKDLAEQLKPELPGILNWALAGLQRLNESGLTVPEKTKELVEEYRRDSDPARAFLLETYLYSPNGDGVGCGDVYDAYVQYCERNKCKPMNNRTFGRHVRRIFAKVERRFVGGRGNQQWTYVGLVSRVSQEIPI